MMRTALAVAITMVVMAPWTHAGAQVTVDVAKITCDQFVLFKITDPQNIAIWLNGYYSAKRNNTLVDTQRFKANAQRLTQYCLLKPNVTVMEAVDVVFGEAQK